MNNTTTAILLGVIIFLFICLFIYLVFNFFSKRNKRTFKQIKSLKKGKLTPIEKQQRSDYFKNNKIDLNKNNSYQYSNHSGLSLKEFEKKINLEKVNLIKKAEQELKRNIDEKAIYLMINAMEQHVEDIVSSRFSFTIKLTDDALKGKIIGRDGRNKRHFEQTTKTDLIIEPNMAAVTISSPNPIRREKAKRTMEKLLETKNMDISKITSFYEEVEKDFENICYEIGKDAIENKLHIFDIDKSIYPIVGKLNFRTSYSQNVLLHCIECAVLASNLALQLKVDPIMAKKAAFFHDIGKAVDFEIDNDHVNSGVMLAKEFKLEDYIVNAIESHHNKVPAKTVYAALVKVVDKLSASRPGARFVSNEDYFKRIEELENICKSFKGVIDVYAIKSGREIEIIVSPDELSDDECKVLIKEIKFKLEECEFVNKQPIQVTLVRKFVQTVKTSGSASRVRQDEDL